MNGKRLLEIHQAGLFDYLEGIYRRMPSQCLKNYKTGLKSSKNQRITLSLKNLTGAFIVLLVGLGISFLAFIYEHIDAKLLTSAAVLHTLY